MKKIILSMLMLLFVALAFADNKVDSVKAIIAVEFHKVSLKDSKYQEALNKTFPNVDSVKSVVFDKKSNVNLCEAIKKLKFKLSGDTIDGEVINLILNSEEKEIVDFFKKDNKRKEKIKKNIEKKFDEYNSNVKKYIAKLSAREDKPEKKAVFEEQANPVGNVPWKTMFFIAIFVLCLSIAGFLFYVYQNKKDIEKKNKEIEESHKEQIYKKKNNISELENENKSLRGKIRTLENEIENYKEAEIYLEGEIVRLKNKLSGSTVCGEKTKDAPVLQNKITHYLGLAPNGLFVNIYEQYKPGKVLFQLSTYDNETGEFEFILKPETLSMVNTSRTRTIETACVLENGDISIINSIETIKKGTVKKESNGWIIKEKAVVRLS